MNESVRKRRGLGRSTVFDVAKLAQTSAISVSRYFKEPERVSQETRERIKSAIDQLGYIRNEAAGGLASTQGRIVGAIVPSVSNSIFAETIQGLSTTLSKHNYQLLLATHDYSIETEEKVVRAFLGWSPRALVLTGADHSAATETLLAGLHIPVIETWDVRTERPYPQIGFSHRATGRDMTLYLHGRGYRKIVYVDSGIGSDFRARKRAEGYEETMRELGLAPQVVQAIATAPLDAGAEVFSAQMARADRPDALFFANDNMAAGAIYEAARAGIRIPEHCAVAGFGDFPFSEKLTPALTTIRVPRYDIGCLAAQAILLRLGELEEGGAPLAPEPLLYELIARASA